MSRGEANDFTIYILNRGANRAKMRQVVVGVAFAALMLFLFLAIFHRLPASDDDVEELLRSTGSNNKMPEARVKSPKFDRFSQDSVRAGQSKNEDPVGENDQAERETGGDAPYEERSSKPTAVPQQQHKKTVLIVGAGLSGGVIGERIASTCDGYHVTILDQRDHIGGNCYDFVDNETAIRVHKYGSHLFHTFDDGVWNYLSQFTEWTPYEHRVLAKIETGQTVEVPVNIKTVNAVFNLTIKTEDEMKQWLEKNQVKPPGGVANNSEETAKARVGEKLYELLFKHYTKKQWDKYAYELAPSVLERIPVRSNADGRYFTDTYQALPKKGYTEIFRNMFNNSNIVVKLKHEFFKLRKAEKLPKTDYTFFTGPIDNYFASAGLPKLEYRTLVFHKEVFDASHGLYQPGSAVNYGTPKVPYTRSIEYAHFPNQEYDFARLRPLKTIVVHETSSDVGEPYYPVPNPRNTQLYAKYQKMAEEEKDIVFVGRLASYKYFDMDDAVRNALNTFEEWVKGNSLEKECDLSLSAEFLQKTKDQKQ